MQRETEVVHEKKGTVIVTGASQGIGAAITRTLVRHGYNVVANSRNMSKTNLGPASQVVTVDGDIAESATAENLIATAIDRFGSVDHLINNAGIYTAKPFPAYSAGDLKKLLATNVYGFFFITQLAVQQMIGQGGGSVTTITAALAENPQSNAPSALSMLTKGGLNAATLSLASEYARRNIRFNAVAPGIVDTPMHGEYSRDLLKSFTPMGIVSEDVDVAEAVIYLLTARYVTGEVMHVDGGAHAGRW